MSKTTKSVSTSTLSTSTVSTPTLATETPEVVATIYEVEVIFEKCGKDSDKFYKWCSKGLLNSKIETKCEGLFGTVGACDYKAQFTENDSIKPFRSGHIELLATNTTEFNSTTTPPVVDIVSPPTTGKPNFIYWKHICSMGGSKKQNNDGFLKMDGDKYDKLTRLCSQKLYGVQGMSLWLILLICFLVLTAVITAFALFWRYWLRKRVYGPAPGETVSAINSQYTSSPYSQSEAGREGSSSSSRKRRGASSAMLSGSLMPSTRMASGSRMPSGSRIPSGSRMPSSGGRSVMVSGSKMPSSNNVSSASRMYSNSRLNSGRNSRAR